MSFVEKTPARQTWKQELALQDGLDGKVLAEELLALESHFNQSTMNPMGGTKMAGDWTVTIDGGAGRYAHSCRLLPGRLLKQYLSHN